MRLKPSSRGASCSNSLCVNTPSLLVLRQDHAITTAQPAWPASTPAPADPWAGRELAGLVEGAPSSRPLPQEDSRGHFSWKAWALSDRDWPIAGARLLGGQGWRREGWRPRRLSSPPAVSQGAIGPALRRAWVPGASPETSSLPQAGRPSSRASGLNWVGAPVAWAVSLPAPPAGAPWTLPCPWWGLSASPTPTEQARTPQPAPKALATIPRSHPQPAPPQANRLGPVQAPGTVTGPVSWTLLAGTPNQGFSSLSTAAPLGSLDCRGDSKAQAHLPTAALPGWEQNRQPVGLGPPLPGQPAPLSSSAWTCSMGDPCPLPCRDFHTEDAGYAGAPDDVRGQGGGRSASKQRGPHPAHYGETPALSQRGGQRRHSPRQGGTCL